jgi:hypothetical protein
VYKLTSTSISTLTQLFPLGNVYQTPGVLEAIPSEDVLRALARHHSVGGYSVTLYPRIRPSAGSEQMRP